MVIINQSGGHENDDYRYNQRDGDHDQDGGGVNDDYGCNTRKSCGLKLFRFNYS